MIEQEETNYTAQVDLDAQLAARVAAIQAAATGSPERQQRLNQLVNQILGSGKLGHPQAAVWPPHIYTDLYNEALQKTLIDICQTIDQYRPEHPVMAWVNFRLQRQFLEVVKDQQRLGITQIPRSESIFSVRLPSLEDLPLMATREEAADLQIQQFLQQDPERRLQKRLRDHPQVTFQSLAIAKFVQGRSWTELAADLNISAQTLCSFFNRQLKELIPYFKRYLER